MSRTVAALYSTRAEAETAQARLKVQLPTQEASVLGASEQAQLARFDFLPADRASYEKALAGGDYLVCATVAPGQDSDRIVRILADSVSAGSAPAADAAAGSPIREEQREVEASGGAPAESLFIGAAWIARGGAQVNYSAPEVERHKVSRSPFCPEGSSRLEEDVLEQEGLFRQRTIEFSEMGEVPLISRRPVVREELIVHRAAEDRTRIIRGTVRRTAVDVTDLNSDRAEPPGRDNRN
jgi:hypothetical protein